MAAGQRKAGTTTHPILFRMVLTSDHLSDATGKSPAVTISKDGAAFGAAAGAVTELSSGWYALAGHATDRDTVGPFLIHATASATDPVNLEYEFVSYDPFADVTTAKLAFLDAAISSNSLALHSGTAQDGAAGTITLASGASATNSLYVGETVMIYGGTGAGQSRVITAYVGSSKVATVDHNWTTNPDSTSTYRVLATSANGAANVLLATTLAELAQGAPAATPAVKDALMLLYMALRNEVTEDGSFMTLSNDAGTVIAKAPTSDANGVTTRGEFITGA